MKYKKISPIIAVALAMGATSCESFLDDQPRGYAIAKTIDEYNGLFNSTFFMNMMSEDYTMFLTDDIFMDEATLSAASDFITYGRQESFERAYRYEHDIYENIENCELWEGCYRKVYTYNVIIDGVMNAEDGTEKEKLALQAEARVSRAWLHFVLAQAFAAPYNLPG